MAVQNRTETDNQSTTPKSVAFDPTKLKQLPRGAATPIDTKDDPWEAGKPPYGWFLVKLYPATNDPYLMGYREYNEDKTPKESTVWYMTNNELRIQNKDSEFVGASVFARLSTMVGWGNSISTMAAVIARSKWADKLKPEMAPAEVVALFTAIQKREPAFWVFVDWKGYSSEDKKNVFPTYDTFPNDGKGGKHNLVIRTAKNGIQEQIRARAEVTAWRKDTDPPSDEERKGKAKRVTAPVDDLDLDDTEVDRGTGKAVKATKVNNSGSDDLDEIPTSKASSKAASKSTDTVADPGSDIDVDSLID